MNEVKVTYNVHTDKDQQDPAFYCWGDQQVIAEVKKGERILEIWAVGEMRLNIPYENSEGTWDEVNYDIVRYTEDLEGYAKTDQQLLDLGKKWLDRGLDIWVNNNWFEVVEIIDGVAEDGWDVHHSLSDAIEHAVSILA